MSRHVLTVGGPEPGAFATIGAAVARAEPDATIIVHPGRYAERLVLDKRVTISAEPGGPVEVHVEEGSVLVVCGEGAQLRGVTLISDDPQLAALDVYAGEVALDDCRVTGAAWTALLARMDGTLALRGCDVRAPSGAGIVVMSAGASTVEDTLVHDVGTSGVVVSEHGSLTLRRCVVRGAKANGVCANGEARLVMEQCDVVGAAKPAVVVEQRATAQIRHLTVSDSANVDLFLRGEIDVMISDSTFSGAAVQSAHITDGAAPGSADARSPAPVTPRSTSAAGHGRSSPSAPSPTPRSESTRRTPARTCTAWRCTARASTSPSWPGGAR